ncbi:MAG: YraN family protein, partial [Lachnospiraceae bacterium]|nr:YraN family protein [Lachnospiraceae bacterium]
MNKRGIGTEYETRAVEYLEKMGYHIICRNYRCRRGEIDLVAGYEDYLVFIEVKYRGNNRSGSAAEAVDTPKQRRIIRVARWYLMEHHIPENHPVRFDVVAFDGKEVHVI